MGLYANINNIQKELTSLNVNIGNSQKSISAAYTNIGGTQKQIFEAKKYHWWKAYPVTSWEQIKSYNNYNSSTEGDYAYSESWQAIKGAYKTCTLQSNGKFLLSNYFTFTWVDEESETNSYGTTYYSKTKESDFYTVNVWYPTSSTYTTSYPVYCNYVANSTQLENSSGSTIGSYTIFSITYGLYAKPTAHSSTYKLIKCNNYYQGYVPNTNSGIQSDGTYPVDRFYYLFNYDGNNSDTGIGYGLHEAYDDYGDLQFYYFDGYYWEYLGYYA